MASTQEERLIPQPFSDTAAITVRLWKTVLAEQDERSYAAGVADTEAKSAALVEASERYRAAVERWFTTSDNVDEELWMAELRLDEALRQLEKP